MNINSFSSIYIWISNINLPPLLNINFLQELLGELSLPKNLTEFEKVLY